MGIFQEMCSQDVGKGMIFSVEREHGAVWSACVGQRSAMNYPSSRAPSTAARREDSRVSGTSEHFFSPSPSRNNSNLSSVLAKPVVA
jgi:hypothetical protein